MKQTAVMIVENKVEAEAIALFDGELTFIEFINNISKYFNQAKVMEKQQIIDAYNNGEDRSAELYYNETFKSE
jgi:hypothetical protein